MSPKKKEIPLMEKQSTELGSTTPVDNSTNIVRDQAYTVDMMMQSMGASGTKIF